jgi:hypothetical protein
MVAAMVASETGPEGTDVFWEQDGGPVASESTLVRIFSLFSSIDSMFFEWSPGGRDSPPEFLLTGGERFHSIDSMFFECLQSGLGAEREQRDYRDYT